MSDLMKHLKAELSSTKRVILQMIGLPLPLVTVLSPFPLCISILFVVIFVKTNMCLYCVELCFVFTAKRRFKLQSRIIRKQLYIEGNSCNCVYGEGFKSGA